MNVKHKFITAPFHDMCSNNNNGNLYKPESFADIYCIILMHSSKKKQRTNNIMQYQFYAILFTVFLILMFIITSTCWSSLDYDSRIT